MRINKHQKYCWLIVMFAAVGAAAQPLSEDPDSLADEKLEPVLGPYEAKVLVESQSELDRIRAMSIGLQEVIGRLLGNEDAIYEPEVIQALRTPQQYVMQYSYTRDANDGLVETFLQMRFLPRRVDDLLRAAHQLETGELQNIGVDVQGIADFAGYATTLKTLQELAMVREVTPGMVQAGRIEFRLLFEGDVKRLTAALEEQTNLYALDNSVDPLFADRLSYELR